MGLSLPSLGKNIWDAITGDVGGVVQGAEHLFGINQPQNQPAPAPPVVPQINQAAGFRPFIQAAQNMPPPPGMGPSPIPSPAKPKVKFNPAVNVVNTVLNPGSLVTNPFIQKLGGAAANAIIPSVLPQQTAGESDPAALIKQYKATGNINPPKGSVGTAASPLDVAKQGVLDRLFIGKGGSVINAARGAILTGNTVQQATQTPQLIDTIQHGTPDEKFQAVVNSIIGVGTGLAGAGLLHGAAVDTLEPSNAVKLAGAKATTEAPVTPEVTAPEAPEVTPAEVPAKPVVKAATPEAPAINALANPKGPDVVGNGSGQSFLDTLHIMNDEAPTKGKLLNGARGGIGDLEYKLMQDRGHFESGNIMLAKLAKESQQISEADKTAVFHYRTELEAGVTPRTLTPYQQHVNDNIVQPMVDKLNELNGSNDRNYTPRLVQDKNTKYQQYLEGERKAPTESMTRKTVDTSKGRTLRSLTDENGNRTTVSLDREKGRVRVTAWKDNQPTDLGPLKRHLPTPVKEFYDPQVRASLQKTADNLGVKSERVVRIKGKGARSAGVSYTGRKLIQTRAASPEDTIIHELGHQIDEKYGLQEKWVNDPAIKQELRDLADQRMGDSTSPSFSKYVRKGEEKMAVMFQAWLRNPELFKEVAPNAFAKFSDFLGQHEELAPLRDVKRSLELASGTVGDKDVPGQFVDKSGNRYTIGEPTTDEVHQNTNARYFTDPIMSTALAVANKTNALNAEHTTAWVQAHPEYDKYFSSTDNTRPSVRTLGVTQHFQVPETRTLGNVYAHPAAAKILNNYLGNPHATNLAERIWQGANSPFIQVIIVNPAIHGSNLFAQGFIQGGNAPLFRTDNPILNKIPSGPIAILKQAAAQKRMVDSAYRAKTVHEMLQNGMHLDTYGKDRETIVTKAVDAAGLPSSAQFSKYNARAMAALDLNFRATTYDSDVRSGMSPRQAVSQINTFMGKQDNVGAVGRNVGMFYRWLKTEGRSIKFQALSPEKNIGSIINVAILGAATTYGLSAAYQALTGNPNAHVRNMGELGLLNDVRKTATAALSGNPQAALSEVTNVASGHMNPLANAAIAGGTDIAQTKGSKVALSDAGKKLFAPEQNISKIQSGKMAPLEAALTEFGGLYTPHAPNAPAAPNIPALNAAAAKPAPDETFQAADGTTKTISDPTGYQQEQAHYQALDQQKAQLADDPNAQTALTDFFTRSHDDKGNTIQLNPVDRIAQYHNLLGDDRLLDGVVATEQGGSHAPSWDLPKDKLAAYLDYQSQYTGDPERTRMMQKYTWLKDAVQADQNFYNGLPKNGNPAPWQPTTQQQSDLQSYGYSMGDTKYPQFDQQTQDDLKTYNNLTDSTARGQFLTTHPNVATAFGQISRYTNASRIVEGALPTQGYPNETPQVKAILDSMPQGTDKASAKARALLINSHPDVNQFLADVALYNTTKDLAGYYLKINPNQTEGGELNNGSAESQQALKGIVSLGQYDIGKNAAGQYSFVQKGALPAGSQSAAGKSSAAFAKKARKVSGRGLVTGVKRVHLSKLHPMSRYGMAKVAFSPKLPIDYRRKRAKVTLKVK